jgi:hypothetical protein
LEGFVVFIGACECGDLILKASDWNWNGLETNQKTQKLWRFEKTK